MDDDQDRPRTGPDAALRALVPFADRLLPAMLRRLANWRGYSPQLRQQLLADLRQELQLDCLTFAAEILALPTEQRHQRWFRMAERWIYRHYLRGDAVADRLPIPAAAPPPEPESLLPALGSLLPGLDAGLLDGLATGGSLRRNGRCNVTATAAQLGLRARKVRQLWERAASRLGYDDHFLAFWRRRLAEALTDYAAGLLRDRGLLFTLDRRGWADPGSALRRIRRIHSVLRVRPLPIDLRQALTPFLRCGPGSLPEPVAALEHAACLAPAEAAVAAWQFEAQMAVLDLGAAARALRRARAVGLPRHAALLAAARLCEARRGTGAALLLLSRAVARHRRGDHRLRQAMALAQEPIAAASTSATSRSASGSGRGSVQDGCPPSQPPRR